jgi:hypothetical protein
MLHEADVMGCASIDGGPCVHQPPR